MGFWGFFNQGRINQRMISFKGYKTPETPKTPPWKPIIRAHVRRFRFCVSWPIAKKLGLGLANSDSALMKLIEFIDLKHV
jgi:hypothetical protein